MQLGSLTWDDTGDRVYYTGIDGVALYVWNDAIKWYGGRCYNVGENPPTGHPDQDAIPFQYVAAWNGVTAINESPSGAESNKVYADNIEYLNLLSKEEFGFTLECYQVPEAFDQCDGIASLADGLKFRGKSRKPFALVYRVQKGSDTTAAGELGYIYHIVYGCKASPSSRDFATVNDSPEAQTFSYEITATAPTYPTTSVMTETEYRSDIDPEADPPYSSINNSMTPYTHIEIDTTRLSPKAIRMLEKRLYGYYQYGPTTHVEESAVMDDFDRIFNINVDDISYITKNEYFGDAIAETNGWVGYAMTIPTPDELIVICNQTGS